MTDWVWQGREDGVGLEHRRLHHLVRAEQMGLGNDDAEFKATLLGFACDEGVQRNQGRVGAKNAPLAIRQALANLPVHGNWSLRDGGDICCDDGHLELAQQQLANEITTILAEKRFPIVLGGGHEVAFASFSGIWAFAQQQKELPKIGVINFDAHFDLRCAEHATSGTPFYQAAECMHAAGQSFSYLCLGIAKHANTAALFQRAKEWNVIYALDDELSPHTMPSALEKLNNFLASVDWVYLSVDLDVFHAAIAPGVSAPAVRGIDLASFEVCFSEIIKSQKVKLLDIAECNPLYDRDGQTAKLAAYIVYQLLLQKT